MNKFRKYLPSIVFNIAEMAIIWLCGLLLKLDSPYIILVVLSFCTTRFMIGKQMHYRQWQKCLLWSTLVFLSLFVLAKAGIVHSALMSIFCALILSNRADIRDMFMFAWKPAGQSKYQTEMDYVIENPNNHAVLKFESKLKNDPNKLDYAVYSYIFKQRLSWGATAELLNLETYQLTPIVDRLAFSLGMLCDI